MTTPKDKSKEVPYTGRRHESAMSLRWVIDGPTDPHEWFLSYEQAQKECGRLNAAYAAGRAAQLEIVAWIPEDELPASLSGEAYNALYPHSKVDFIRLFPVFAPPPSAPTVDQIMDVL